MKLKCLLLFLSVSFFSSAQISGYMGKRAVIGYSNYFMFGFKGPGPINSGPNDEASFTINNAHCLNFEYAYKERKMVCISGQYIKTGVAYDRGLNDGFFGSSTSDYPYPGGSRYAGSFNKPALLTSINLGLGVKTFKNGFIAPTGRYRKIEVVLLFEKLKYDSKNFKVSVNAGDLASDTLKTLGKGEYSYKNIAFAYTIGKQRILNDKFVFDFGIRFAFTPAMNIFTLTSGSENTSNTEAYFRRASNLRMARQQLVNFHLGIGFLAF